MIIFNLIRIIKVAKAGDGVISDTHGVRKKSSLFRMLKNAPACGRQAKSRGVRRTWPYGATNKDKRNEVDGRFSASCQTCPLSFQ